MIPPPAPIPLCLPHWNTSPPFPSFPNTTPIPLWNLGQDSTPKPLPRHSPLPLILDWEYPFPKQAFPAWNTLLRSSSLPSDIVYGFDPSVNHAYFDETPGLIAKKLRPYRVSFSLDLYYHQSESLTNFFNRVRFRLNRLRQVQALLSTPSYAFISPVIQYARLPADTDPLPLSTSTLTTLLSQCRLYSVTPLIYAASSTPSAHATILPLLSSTLSLLSSPPPI